MVVEDELLIRMVVAETLTEAGFEVHEAQNAEEALKMLESQAANVGVLITDIHMPGRLDGIELANRVAERWPWVSVIVTSGRAGPKIPALPAGGRFLAKPYIESELVEHVRNAIADGGDPPLDIPVEPGSLL